MRLSQGTTQLLKLVQLVMPWPRGCMVDCLTGWLTKSTVYCHSTEQHGELSCVWKKLVFSYISPTCDFDQSLYIIISDSSMSSTTQKKKVFVCHSPLLCWVLPTLACTSYKFLDSWKFRKVERRKFVVSAIKFFQWVSAEETDQYKILPLEICCPWHTLTLLVLRTSSDNHLLKPYTLD